MENSDQRTPCSGDSAVFPPTPLWTYMESRTRPTDEMYLDSQRFLDMHLNKEQTESETVKVLGKNYMSGGGGWVKRWSHWGNLGPREHPSVDQFYMPYVSWFEEVEYRLRVTE